MEVNSFPLAHGIKWIEQSHLPTLEGETYHVFVSMELLESFAKNCHIVSSETVEDVENSGRSTQVERHQ